MRLCPRCRVRVEGRTCKRCGAFVDGSGEPETTKPTVVEAEPPTDARVLDEIPAPPKPEPPDEAISPGSWRCPKCSEQVEAAFHACWQCGTEKGAPAEPGREGNAAAEVEARAPDSVADEPRSSPLACVRCDSTRMIPDQIVEDRSDHGGGELHTVVYAHPNAWIFKNALRGRLRADICGDCGHVELRVEDPGALYEHYRNSRGT